MMAKTTTIARADDADGSDDEPSANRTRFSTPTTSR
jgi:hypothetical protein